MLKIPSPPSAPPENWIHVRLKQVQSEVESLIGATPTSDRRNSLTDINIHLMSALEVFKKLPRAE